MIKFDHEINSSLSFTASEIPFDQSHSVLEFRQQEYVREPEVFCAVSGRQLVAAADIL